jgi:hypothetical protein
LFGNRWLKRRVQMTPEAQAIFFRRRHQPRTPPSAKIRPGSPAPATGGRGESSGHGGDDGGVGGHQNPETGSVTIFRKNNRPALGPLGDSLDDLRCGAPLWINSGRL